MAFEKEERETHITTDDTMDYWILTTRQQKIMTKMQRIGVKPYKGVKEDGRFIEAEYKLDIKQVSFRKLIELTEEQKLARSEHMRKIREKKDKE